MTTIVLEPFPTQLPDITTLSSPSVLLSVPYTIYKVSLQAALSSRAMSTARHM